MQCRSHHPQTPLTAVADAVLGGPVLAEAMAEAGQVRALDLTGPAAVRPLVVKGLADAGRTVLAVTATAREAEDLVVELADLLDPATVAYYPSWETLPHERLSPRSDTVGRRLAVLRRLKHPGTDASNGPLRVIVAPVRSILQPQVKGLADLEPVELTKGATAALDDVVRGLADAAYSRVDMVERRGEFAVRGGIVDVFPPTEEHPLRVEFWGDEVEEIRSFSVADQRTVETLDRLWAPPCRELLLTEDVRRRAAALGQAHPQLLELTDKIAAGIAVEGMESLAPGAGRRDGAAGRPAARHDDRAGARPRARPHPRPRPGRDQRGVPRRELGGRREWRPVPDRPRCRVLPRGGRRARQRDRAQPRLVDGQPVRHRELDRELDVDVLAGAVPSRALSVQGAEAYRGDMDKAIADIRGWLADGYRVTVVHQGHGPAERMVEVLGEHDVPAALIDGEVDPRQPAS